MRTEPLVHAVFSAAAGGHLKQVRHMTGRPDDRIIALDFDDLSLGPIDRIDGESRTRWLRELYGDEVGELYAGMYASIDAFWSEVASSERCIVAWLSRRDASEYAGLLELVRQRGDAPLEIVDVTDVEFPDLDGGPLKIGELSPEQTIKLKLLESAAPMPTSTRLRFAQTWARLREENALLRIVETGTLVSAPLTHYDARLVSFVAPEWQSLGSTLGPFYETARAAGFNPPNLWFVLSRLAALVEAGVLEREGDFSMDGHSQSRLRRPRE